MKNKKILFISVLVFLVVIVVLIIISVAPKTKILFTTAPESVSVIINNKTYSVNNEETINFKPGTYEYKVSSEGFGDYTNKITVKSGETSELLVALEPTTDAAKSLLLNDKSQLVMQRFYGLNKIQYIKTISDKYPLIDILPIRARLYTIYTCNSVKYPNDTTKIAVCVDMTSDELKPYVIKDIESRGFKINDYEIIFKSDGPIGE